MMPGGRGFAVDCRGIFLHNKFMDFRWNDWNIEHIGGHGVSSEEAELVINTARSPFPRRIQEDKWIVWGQGSGGRVRQPFSFWTRIRRFS
jgi:hypothetical protein